MSTYLQAIIIRISRVVTVCLPDFGHIVAVDSANTSLIGGQNRHGSSCPCRKVPVASLLERTAERDQRCHHQPQNGKDGQDGEDHRSNRSVCVSQMNEHECQHRCEDAQDESKHGFSVVRVMLADVGWDSQNDDDARRHQSQQRTDSCDRRLHVGRRDAASANAENQSCPSRKVPVAGDLERMVKGQNAGRHEPPDEEQERVEVSDRDGAQDRRRK
mmetsp:Transcript_8787/g.25279  ORF Transcript_8787/g.25279 Transcript_8787/m.25279 type:complete len:216 (-) Transcript_8787:24-671(-)